MTAFQGAPSQTCNDVSELIESVTIPQGLEIGT